MERGDEIIFAEEAGCWMIPADEREWLPRYLESLAATATDESYAATVIPLLERDSGHSFANRLYDAAIKAANPQQRKLLKQEIKRRGVRTQRDY